MTPKSERQVQYSFEAMRSQVLFEEKHVYRNKDVYFFDQNARGQYESLEYSDRVEGVCVIVPIIEENDESGIVLMKNCKKTSNVLAYGVIGVDTLRCENRDVFSQHEKEFYEGLAKVFNEVYFAHRQRVSMSKILARSMDRDFKNW